MSMLLSVNADLDRSGDQILVGNDVCIIASSCEAGLALFGRQQYVHYLQFLEAGLA